MSYNPNQDPYSGYGNPPYGPPPQGPYGQPQAPYGVPPYGQPQGPYGPPPQAPYGVPPYQQPGYGYAAPPVVPLPLGEAIRQLPRQYIKVVTKPSAATFAEEQGKAAWNIVWVQLLGIAILSAIFIFLIFQLVLPFTMSSSNVPAGTVAAIEGWAVGIALAEIILIPLFYFITSGIYYLIAKAFGGQGTYLTQSYSALLFYIPLAIVGFVLELIPCVGGLAAFALFIYEIVLGVYMTMAVHRLTGGKATLVVLLPILVPFALICLILIISLIAAAGARPH